MIKVSSSGCTINGELVEIIADIAMLTSLLISELDVDKNLIKEAVILGIKEAEGGEKK